MYKKRRRSSVIEKFRAVSGTVWVCLKGMIVGKTIKEESSQNNHYNDNYNYNCAQLLNSQLLDFQRTVEEYNLKLKRLKYESLSMPTVAAARCNGPMLRSISVREVGDANASKSKLSTMKRW